MKRTVLELLKKASEKYKDSPYLLDKSDEGYVSKSFFDVEVDSTLIASELVRFGFLRNDKIAVLSEGRTNWIIGEFGILKAGCISVPLSVKLLPEELLFRLNHSESKAIMVSRGQLDKVLQIWKRIEHKGFKIIYFDNEIDPIKPLCDPLGIDVNDDIWVFKDMLTVAKKFAKKSEVNLNELHKLVASISEDDIVNICYTSGTTDNPKAIMLSHFNYYSNSIDAITYFDIPEKIKLMNILPIDHSFAHTVATYAALLRGVPIYFLDSRGGAVNALKNIPINLKEANPDFMLTVPALSGNLIRKIVDGINEKGIFAKAIFNMGLISGRSLNKDGYRKAGFFTKLIFGLPFKIADWFVFSNVRKVFGEQLKFCVGGGALLDIKQQHFYYTIGIPIYQGYGLTEAAPIISVNTPSAHKLGTSGRILPNIKCKILLSGGNEAAKGEKGEIVIQGDNVMKGYFKNQEATDEALKNGWLHTGDIGYFDEDDFLVVVGREKALLISTDGEKYSPETIEEAINNTTNFVSQTLIYNDHNKYTTALVTLDKSNLEKYIKKHKITAADMMIEEVKKSFYSFKHNSEYKNAFPDKWIPATFRILAEPFSESNGMLNSSMKIVRHKIVQTYKEDIAYMNTSEGLSIANKKNLAALQVLIDKLQ